MEKIRAREEEEGDIEKGGSSLVIYSTISGDSLKCPFSVGKIDDGDQTSAKASGRIARGPFDVGKTDAGDRNPVNFRKQVMDDDIARQEILSHHTQQRELNISLEDKVKINELRSQKVGNFYQIVARIGARSQRQIRVLLNNIIKKKNTDLLPENQLGLKARLKKIIDRDRNNNTEITYENINIYKGAYFNPEYAELVIDRHNNDIDEAIKKIEDDAQNKIVYEQELEEVKHYNEHKLDERLRSIPTEVGHEIIKLLKLDPNPIQYNIAAQANEVKQKIVALFNAFIKIKRK